MMEPPVLPLVLLAEDDPDDRLLLSEAFAEAGVEVQLEMVPDGQALLDFLHRRGDYSARSGIGHPALILCDINMPRLSGLEAVEALRAEDEFSAIPVAMLTSSRRDEDRGKSFSAGANQHYVKPSSFREMVDMVRDVTSRFVESG